MTAEKRSILGSTSASALKDIGKLSFYQKIDLPDGTTTNGRADHRKDPQLLGLSENSLNGKRFLDIAANDGFWSFWAEANGASEVLAIDVEKYEDYDWGLNGCPAGLQGKTAKNVNFDKLHALFKSRVAREHVSIYDLSRVQHGEFDLTFCYGLLYHLRHPLLAIDKMRQVTSGLCVIKTHTFVDAWDIPQSLFFLDDVFDGAVTNWTGATESCVVHWMRDAGFPHIFAQRREASFGTDRRMWAQMFVGIVGDEYISSFKRNRNFVFCDDSYFYHSRRKIKSLLYPFSK